MSSALDVMGRLASGGVVILDGGMGTQLQAEDVPMDDAAWSARANLDQPDAVQRVHEEYIRAGADVIIANTFAANRTTLEPAGLGDKVAEVNRAAMRAAREARAAAAASRPVAVAGSISSFCPAVMDASPLSQNPGAVGYPSLDDFREQAQLLAEAGAELIALEMIGGQDYGSAAVQAATETGLPVWLGLSPDRQPDGTLGTLPDLGDGGVFEELVRAIATPGLAAVNVMHARPDVTLDAIEIIRRHYAGPIGVYAETGEWTPPNWVFSDMNPEEYLAQAITWASNGAQIIGGCCGTGPEHIALIAARLASPNR